MPNLQLIDTEWNQLAWGNFETNVDFLRRVGLPTQRLDMLEIGCGKGAMLDHLHGAGHAVAGVDVDAEALAHCRKVLPHLRVSVASGDSLPFEDAAFDVVVSFDVFEHIRDSDKHLAEVRRVLRSGGRYLLQTPNKWTNVPFEVVRQCRKMQVGPVRAYRELLEDHCALHNYWELQRRFRRNGFAMRFVDVPVVNDYFRSKVRNYLGVAGTALLSVVNPDRFPMALRTNFYVEAYAQAKSGQVESRSAPELSKRA